MGLFEVVIINVGFKVEVKFKVMVSEGCFLFVNIDLVLVEMVFVVIIFVLLGGEVEIVIIMVDF